MKRALVVTHGFFGDILFSTTCAKPLKEQYGFEYVDYLIGFPQVLELIKPNPHIDDIYMSSVGPEPSYDHFALESTYDICQLREMTFEVPPPTQMQMDIGLKPPYNNEYTTYTNPELVSQYREQLEDESDGKPIVCWGNDMYDRAFEYTEEEYERAVDVPYKGYGGRLRDIDYMIKELSRWFHMVEVGVRGKNQHQVERIKDERTVPEMAAVMEAADLYFGIEGGLVNIVAGTGTPTVILPEYHHQLYGPKGVIRQIEEPKLGPRYYFGSKYHKELPLYKTTDELIDLARQELFDLLAPDLNL